MAKKVKLTRPELKRYRDALERFERYLPMLKLKQQQLQLTLRNLLKEQSKIEHSYKAAMERFEGYKSLLSGLAGINIEKAAKPKEIKKGTKNIAGVNIPVFEGIVFERPRYSLFFTPPWVDQAITDLQRANEWATKLEIAKEQYRLLNRELTKVIQRVNLFEKIKIPEAKEAIRLIRIKLGDEMTAAVARAKIAKAKLRAEERLSERDVELIAD